MATPVRNLRLPLPLAERVDAARGVESFTSFVIRALEALVERERPPVPRPTRRRPSSAEAKAGVVPR